MDVIHLYKTLNAQFQQANETIIYKITFSHFEKEDKIMIERFDSLKWQYFRSLEKIALET